MSEETEVVELDKDLEKIAASLDKLTLLQASKLVQHLEDKWGVSAAAPVAVAAAPAASGGEEVAEQTSFDAVLEAFGEKKIQVIKEVRAITNLGLKEAKELVDSAPKTIKEGCSKEEAEEIKQRIEAVGGTVKLA